MKAAGLRSGEFYTQVTHRMREAKLIEDPAALEAALFRMHGAERIALDTEFMRERTYRPQLCLVQLATASDCYLIDPLAGLDLAPMYELLAARRTLKILHAGRQDLEVMLLGGGTVPGPIFDTQVAAALLGLSAASWLRGTGGATARPFNRQGPDANGLVAPAAHTRAARLCRRRRAPPVDAAD